MQLLLLCCYCCWEEAQEAISLNGDGDVSRYPMLMSVFHGRARLYLSLLFCLYPYFFPFPLMK